MTDSRVLNAVIGAVVTLVLSFTGFSPIVGGGVAAWLQEGDKSESIRVGALSGVFALLPILMIFIGGIGLYTGITVAIFAFVVGIVFAAVFIVGLSSLGGYLVYYLLKDRRISGERIE